MAKLTDRQKDNIRAKWHTGQYTKTALAKSYKVTEKVIRNIVGKEEPRNADIVEAAVLVETAKKSAKSPSETAAINAAVKERLSIDDMRAKIDDVSMKILDKVDVVLTAGKKKVGTVNGLREVPLDIDDLKTAQDTVDKVSITTKVNDRHAPKGDVNVQTNVQNNTEIKTFSELYGNTESKS